MRAHPLTGGGSRMNAPVLSRAEVLPARADDAWWRRPPVLAVATVALLLLALFAGTAASIVATWERSETFTHGFVVVPICLWLAWRERAALAERTARPWWPATLAVFAAGALWAAGVLGSVMVVQQAALVFMLQAAILAVVGRDVGRALFFPLAFLLFAVPAGEGLIPTLIEWTADFTVGALRVSGVPVFREGNHFVIPSGAWSVVEACSGVRYLIASTMVGVLFAAIAYRSWRRRALFIAASIAVPIVANWLRAYLIVMLGHLSNNRLAVGVDHLIYGWVFFGIVMLGLLWVGARWREDDLPIAGDSNAVRLPPPRRVPAALFFGAAVTAVVAAGVWRPLEAHVAALPAAVVSVPTLPSLAATERWPEAPAFTAWKPRYEGYVRELAQSFGKPAAPVSLYVAYYLGQVKGRELVTAANLLVAREDWNAKQLEAGTEPGTWDGEPVTYATATLKTGLVPFAVRQLFWVDGHVTDSPYVAKARLAWARLVGRDDAAALIVLYTPAGDAAAQLRLDSFAADMSPAIERSLAAAREGAR